MIATTNIYILNIIYNIQNWHLQTTYCTLRQKYIWIFLVYGESKDSDMFRYLVATLSQVDLTYLTLIDIVSTIIDTLIITKLYDLY